MPQKPIEPQVGALTRPGKVLVVDDHPENSLYLFKRIQDEGWQPRLVENDEDGYIEFSKKPEIYAVVLVDLELPPLTNTFAIGLSLVDRMRHFAPDAAIVGYSEKNIEPTEAARRLQMNRASFFVLRDQRAKDVLVDSLALLASSWLIYSPSAANSLPEVIAQEPDPLRGNLMYWRVARALAQNPLLTYEQIAKKCFAKKQYDSNNIAQYAHEIFDRLDLPRNSRRALEEWYRRNQYRYGYDEDDKEEDEKDT